MNPALTPSSWAPVKAWAAPDGTCRCAAALEVGPSWVLQRRNALTPVQLGGCLLGLVLVSAAIGGFFWVLGAAWVSLFSGLEVMAAALAFGAWALHAADGERLTNCGEQLVVEVRRGLKFERHEFDWRQLRVARVSDGLAELRAADRVLRIGAFAAAGERRRVWAELGRECAARQSRRGTTQ